MNRHFLPFLVVLRKRRAQSDILCWCSLANISISCSFLLHVRPSFSKDGNNCSFSELIERSLQDKEEKIEHIFVTPDIFGTSNDILLRVWRDKILWKMAMIIIIAFFFTKVTVLVGHFIQKEDLRRHDYPDYHYHNNVFAVSGERVHIDGPDTGQIGATLELSCST